MPSSISTRYPLLWLGLAIILATTTGITGRSIIRKKTLNTPIAAYLIPTDNTARIKFPWWPSTQLALPRALRSGERLTITAGTSLKLIHADTGVTELVTGPIQLFLQQKQPSETNALVSPLPEILSSINTKPGTGNAIIITSPVGVTRYLNPLITWVARDDTTYDVAVTDPADAFVPPRVARGVRPPIALADLETPQRRQLGVDRNYILVIREANSSTIGGASRLLTTTNAQLKNQLPSSPADLIAEAATAMAKLPARTGDAWLALSRLPSDWIRSELGIRLRLRVSAELNYTEELNCALIDARALKTP